MEAERTHYPIVVIGAGAGGLVVAIGAAKAGKRVLLIEKGNYGGDCTNFGCIPSKATIAAAETAHAIQHADHHGIQAKVSDFNAVGALRRTRQIVQSVRENEEPEALKKLGVDTITGTASFIGPWDLRVALQDGYEQIKADNIVIATGSHPVIPPISGLETAPYLTNETIFDLEEIPEHLGIIGGGPIGSELGQAFSRLGAKVSILQRAPHLLVRESLHVQEKIETIFKEERISLYLGCTLKKVEHNGDKKLTLITDCENIPVSHLLISVGRRPSLEHLDLKNARIATDDQGKLIVDAYGRTSKKHIWAIGDAAGRAIFTHVAENEGRTVLKNLLLPYLLREKIDIKQAIPRVTYTDPEVASVGLTPEQAIEKYGEKKIAIYTLPYTEVDRAIASGRTEGFATIVTKKWSSKILGASIVGTRAGEMLAEVSLAMQHGIPLRKIAKLIHPYPTYSRAIRKLADMWLTKTILPTLKKLIGKGS